MQVPDVCSVGLMQFGSEDKARLSGLTGEAPVVHYIHSTFTIS